jgi:hypothetical protein
MGPNEESVHLFQYEKVKEKFTSSARNNFESNNSAFVMS